MMFTRSLILLALSAIGPFAHANAIELPVPEAGLDQETPAIESVARRSHRPKNAPARTAKVKVEPRVLEGNLARFKHLDPQQKISRAAFTSAVSFYAMNQHRISNHRYLGVIDFSKRSSEPRFCIINLKSGSTECIKTAHGVGSDRNGYAVNFSNRHQSHKSSVGYYLTKATYRSKKHRIALRMEGLSATNSNALARAIVIHPAKTRSGQPYVVDRTRTVSGRSHGCPAIDPSKADRVIAQLKGGAVIYAWHPGFMKKSMD